MNLNYPLNYYLAVYCKYIYSDSNLKVLDTKWWHLGKRGIGDTQNRGFGTISPIPVTLAIHDQLD